MRDFPDLSLISHESLKVALHSVHAHFEDLLRDFERLGRDEKNLSRG